MSKVKTWEEIIFNKIEKTDTCWNWVGQLDKDGYGVFTRKRSGSRKNYTHKAHRTAYRILKGEIPERISVLHTCDNRRCCNPEHLFLGTQMDNIRDAIAKKRAPQCAKGEFNPRHKIKDSDVEDLRQMFKSGNYSKVELSRLFKISETQTREIIKGTRRVIE